VDFCEFKIKTGLELNQLKKISISAIDYNDNNIYGDKF